MCGILGIIAPAGRSPSVTDGRAAMMRDLMAHRGPDGAGLWRHENILLAHRRLAVVDLSPAGGQPMLSASGRSAIVYNGELYNDAELREELAAEGVEFRTRCDAETALAMIDRFGEAALERMRGMFALAHVDLDARRLVLARDPLGIKPLYYAVIEAGGHQELVFASELPAVLAHPAVSARPDFPALSAYLTTIRTTLGSRTLFAGVRTLQPGESAAVGLGAVTLAVSPRRVGSAPARRERAPSNDELREAVRDSVCRHLRADVPTCCMLSGGLDSTIIAALASQAAGERPLRTFAAGTPADDGTVDDLAAARVVGSALRTVHRGVEITRDMFADRWPAMVGALGLPLSTPNEVAINAVARAIRADGCVVTLSGEGADELFGGYEVPLAAAASHLESLANQPGKWRALGGEFQLGVAAWVAPGAKASVLTEGAWRLAEHDHHLTELYTRRFEEIAAESDGPAPLEAHLRFSREVNLTGLLLRLDQATMLEGVEGRTPLADRVIARLAARTPVERKFAPGAPDRPAMTKIALREAFGADLPSLVLARPKASFPLPFRSWLADNASVVRAEPLLRDIFADTTIAAVSSAPERFWPLAWPMINVALWTRRWWGGRAA